MDKPQRINWQKFITALSKECGSTYAIAKQLNDQFPELNTNDNTIRNFITRPGSEPRAFLSECIKFISGELWRDYCLPDSGKE